LSIMEKDVKIFTFDKGPVDLTGKEWSRGGSPKVSEPEKSTKSHCLAGGLMAGLPTGGSIEPEKGVGCQQVKKML